MSSRETPKQPVSRITVPSLRAMKERGEKIVCLTAYDYPTALILDEAGVDVLLVGDSLGMVILGYPDTLSVTMEQMLHHVAAVSRGTTRGLVVADMPFLSYQASPAEAIRNAGRFLKEAGAQAVKLEGGGPSIINTVARLVEVGIPVMGHLGLTPQSINAIGGYKTQGRDEAQAGKILADAESLQEAGAFALVIEAVPSDLAARVTRTLSIPVIGIGAGPVCDGQVLVTPDLLGIWERFTPSFVKRYAEIGALTRSAVTQFAKEVREGIFPGSNHLPS